MKLYANKELTEEIMSIDFGEVELGSSKTVEIYAQNDSDHLLKELKFNVGENVEILESPKSILKQSTEIIKLKWTPNVALTRSLNVIIKVTGKEVY